MATHLQIQLGDFGADYFEQPTGGTPPGSPVPIWVPLMVVFLVQSGGQYTFLLSDAAERSRWDLC